VLFEPFDIATLGVFLDLAKQIHGLGLEAGLAWVIRRDYHLDLYGHCITIGMNPTQSF